SSEEIELFARVVVNATGVFTEDLLQMDGTRSGRLLAVSQGSHFVLPPSWMPGGHALMIPKTDDGRVLFAIPWHHHLVVGTTDEPVQTRSEEPRASAQERAFLAGHISRILGRPLGSGDVLSVWSGLRPLVMDGNKNLSKIARDYKILVSK